MFYSSLNMKTFYKPIMNYYECIINGCLNRFVSSAAPHLTNQVLYLLIFCILITNVRQYFFLFLFPADSIFRVYISFFG